MSRLYTRLLIGVLVFGICLGVAFAAGTVYGRHTAAKADSSGNGLASRSSALGGSAGSANSRSASSATTSASAQTASGATTAAGSGTPTGSNAQTASHATNGGTGNSGSSGSSGTTAGGTGGFRGFGGGGFTTGTIKAINGSTLTMTTAFGTDQTDQLVNTVKIADVSTASKSVLKAGQIVLVSGQRDSTGNLSASSIVTVPSGFVPSTNTTGSTANRGGATGSVGGTGSTGGSGTGSGGARNFGGGGGFGGVTRFTPGTIKSASGSTLTISTTFGADETVTLSSSTKVGSAAIAATATGQSALKTGQDILVSGQRDASGTVTVTAIVTLPSGFLPSNTSGTGA